MKKNIIIVSQLLIIISLTIYIIKFEKTTTEIINVKKYNISEPIKENNTSTKTQVQVEDQKINSKPIVNIKNEVTEKEIKVKTNIEIKKSPENVEYIESEKEKKQNISETLISGLEDEKNIAIYEIHKMMDRGEDISEHLEAIQHGIQTEKNSFNLSEYFFIISDNSTSQDRYNSALTIFNRNDISDGYLIADIFQDLIDKEKDQNSFYYLQDMVYNGEMYSTLDEKQKYYLKGVIDNMITLKNKELGN